MKQYKIEVTIKEDASMNVDAHGFEGGVCLDELEKILNDIDEQYSVDKKPEFNNRVVQSKKVQARRG